MRQAKANGENVVNLALILNGAPAGTQPTPTLPTGSPRQIALDRINFYRTQAGIPFAQLHPRLITAAQNHANYTVIPQHY